MKLKSIVKTGVGVAIIYIIALMFSLFMCDRMSELESKEDESVCNSSLVLHLK